MNKRCNDLWLFVRAYDPAQAHRLDVEKDLNSLHEVFFIAAKENWAGIDSKILLRS